ncbi:MAG: 4Fe-4S dicluster domain-containing protein [Porphyrobacter sp.]|nr:4Fe-4S dicluster domain-containing protein [Porphyrobacter sp.]
MEQLELALVYAAPLVAIWVIFGWIRRREANKATAVLEENRAAGLIEPSSLHPVIDPARCLGCAVCVKACPEGQILGIIGGKAQLVEPTHCIGHGACAAACPTDAISLVFGTATRGIDIPLLSPSFETSVPGIFIAGELGGMGLVKNAIEQGRQAMAAIVEKCRGLPRNPDLLDVLVVGCGPAGISASLAAKEAGLRFETVDQSTLGGTVAHFPRGKMVMTAPAHLPIIGKVKFGEIIKEDLIAFWQDVISRADLHPRFEEQVLAITGSEGHLVATTTKGQYRAKTILLAIGRRGTPRPLGVPGEDLKKVVYRLIDPEQYAGQKVLVVGGGDSALEAAASIAEQPGSHVTLSYRGDAYGRAKPKNRERVRAAAEAGTLVERLQTVVASIHGDHVVLMKGETSEILANDAVIICAGGLLPTQFLQEVGVKIERKFGTV